VLFEEKRRTTGEKKTANGKGKDRPTAVDSSPAGATAVKEKHRKTKMVRMSQSQIDLFLSYNPEPLFFNANLLTTEGP
jgi:hypothetical protein